MAYVDGRRMPLEFPGYRFISSNFIRRFMKVTQEITWIVRLHNLFCTVKPDYIKPGYCELYHISNNFRKLK